MRIELEVPTSLSDITLGQYQKYMKILDQNGGETNDFVDKKLIEIFCDVSLEQVDKIPIRELEKVLEVLQEAFNEKPNLIRHFKLLDVEMGFIPKLDDISLGEYVDLENTMNDWEKMHKAMAVLYRPVNFKKGDKYTIAPYEPSEDMSDLMKQMPMDAVISSTLFFYDLGKELLQVTLNYTQNKVKEGKITLQQKERLLLDGDGISRYMQLLEETYLSSMPSLKRDYSHV